MRCRGLTAVALVSLALCAAACGRTRQWNTTLVYRLQVPGAASPTTQQVGEATRVLMSRLEGSGSSEFAVTTDRSGNFRIGFDATTAAEVADIRGTMERVGSLEFRIRAKLETEVRYREEREAGADPAAQSAEFAWVPCRTPERGPNDMLVHTPERPLAAELEQLRAKGAAESSPEVTDLRSRYEDTLASEVFTGADLESVTLTRQGAEAVLAFEIVDARKADFRDFTKRHVGDQMAIVLDGEVDSAPVIRSELPGRGIICGGGAGFTESEANVLASVLKAEQLPGRLVLVSEERTGTGESEPAPKAAK